MTHEEAEQMTRQIDGRSLTALALVSMLAACSEGESEIAVEGAWLRTPPPGAPTAAVYLTIRNTGDGADRLIAVATPAAETATLHRTRMADGMMRMRPVESLEIPAGERIVLEPGGLHIMLEGLARPIEGGDEASLTLAFEQAGEKALTLPVRSTPP